MTRLLASDWSTTISIQITEEKIHAIHKFFADGLTPIRAPEQALSIACRLIASGGNLFPKGLGGDIC